MLRITMFRCSLLPVLALLLLSACAGRTAPEEQLDVLLCEGEAAIHDGRDDLLRQCLAQGRLLARDSDDYYRLAVLESKYHFYNMHTDSFLQGTDRLGSYLARQPQPLTRRQQALEMERQMQQAVYQMKMAGNFDSAVVCNREAWRLAGLVGSSVGNRLVVLNNLADSYKQLGRYDESVNCYKQALELGDSAGMSTDMHITLTMGIASAYTAMHSFDKSSVWWQKAREMRADMSRPELFDYLNNRGNDYYLQGKYRESLACFLELDSITRHRPDMTWERMFAHANLADVYNKLGQTGQAVRLLDEVEPYFREQQLAIPLYYVATQRIELACKQGRTGEALRLAAADGYGHRMIPEQRVLRLKVLMGLYEQTGDYRRYAETSIEYENLADSLSGDHMKMRVAEAMTQYHHDCQMQEKQRQLEEKDARLRWAAVLLAALLLCIALMAAFYYMKRRERRLKEAEMRNRIVSLRMETVRNRITPHFISNAMQAEMLAQMDGKEVDLDPLVELLHRGIEMTGTEVTTLADELEFISFYTGIESRSIGDDFAYRAELAADVEPKRVKLPSMLVQILVENALKHGLKSLAPQPGRQRMVLVRVSRQGRGTCVEVIDNGRGLTAGCLAKEHTGLKVVRQTVALLNEKNREKMSYGLENRQDGETGCRACIFLPDDFEYTLE